MSATIAFILKGYPRLSESFIAQEIYGLERAGLSLRLYSMRRPTDKRVHPIHSLIQAPIVYLPEYVHDEPLRVFGALSRVARRPGFSAALSAFWRDVVRDPTPNRFRRFGQAAVLVDELAEDVIHLHAHFIHTPASVVRYASLMSGKAWTCSAHAKDIWTSRPWELRQKLADARWTVTCTKAGRETLAGLAQEPERVNLVYHGLDFERFARLLAQKPLRDGRDPTNPVRLLSVGRAVKKKGFDLLLQSLATLPADVHWRYQHIGGGDELARLKVQAEAMGLSQRIIWRGALDQLDVLAAYREADLFVLPARIADNGDRDGLPNVLMEAQSQGLACLSTQISGIPELIIDQVTGVLVPPGDVPALGTSLLRLIGDPGLRQRFGEAGEKRVRSMFDQSGGLMKLLRLFKEIGVPLAPIERD